MAGIIKANAVQLGDSATATQNFVLTTNINGTATLVNFIKLRNNKNEQS